MPEPIDVYADQFMITVGAFGANLSFFATEPHPTPAAPPARERVATIRMSTEHLKTMVLIMKRHIAQTEQQLGVEIRVAPQVLAQLGISPEDWDTFWRSRP